MLGTGVLRCTGEDASLLLYCPVRWPQGCSAEALACSQGSSSFRSSGSMSYPKREMDSDAETCYWTSNILFSSFGYLMRNWCWFLTIGETISSPADMPLEPPPHLLSSTGRDFQGGDWAQRPLQGSRWFFLLPPVGKLGCGLTGLRGRRRGGFQFWSENQKRGRWLIHIKAGWFFTLRGGIFLKSQYWNTDPAGNSRLHGEWAASTRSGPRGACDGQLVSSSSTDRNPCV